MLESERTKEKQKKQSRKGKIWGHVMIIKILAISQVSVHEEGGIWARPKENE